MGQVKIHIRILDQIRFPPFSAARPKSGGFFYGKVQIVTQSDMLQKPCRQRQNLTFFIFYVFCLKEPSLLYLPHTGKKGIFLNRRRYLCIIYFHPLFPVLFQRILVKLLKFLIAVFFKLLFLKFLVFVHPGHQNLLPFAALLLRFSDHFAEFFPGKTLF